MSKVSIIVPVYNAEKAIERCIRSILDQNCRDIECIAVDDGSKDASAEILDRLASEDERLRVIHKPNSGVSATRNLALSMVTGDYVQFLDADDWIPENSTELLLRKAEETGADLVIGDFYRVVGENVARKGSIESEEVLTLQEFASLMMDSPADYYYGVLWNKLYRADIIRAYEIAMDEDVHFAEDFIFNMEYLLHAKTIAPLHVPVYYYVKTEGSLVSQSFSLPKIVAMKRNVFTYYDNFYRNVLDEKDYRKDRLAIAGFLIDAAKDDAAIPMMPGTKKLGEERVQQHYQSGADDILTASYYIGKKYDSYLNTVALKYNLDLKDVQVLSAIHRSADACTIKEVSDVTGFAKTSITAIMVKLNLMDYLELTEGYSRVKLTGYAANLISDLDQMYADFSVSIFQGLNEEEQTEFARLLGRITENLH